jgi:imidazolonepropionase-like amidohydrolase
MNMTVSPAALALSLLLAPAQVFTGARLFDGTGRPAIDDAVLVVRDGRIEAVGTSSSVRTPADARRIDLKGRFVVPGLISSHVHVSDVHGLRPRAYTEENALRQLGVFARYGITTVLSLGGEEDPAFRLRDAQDVATLDRARMYLSGDVVTGETPEAARRKVAEVAAKKPDVLKIRVDDNLGTAKKIPPEVYRAVIEDAHARGLRVAAHVFYLDDAKGVLRAGADIIAHSVRDQDVDDELVGLLKQRGAAYVPTLTREISTFVYETKPEFFSDPFFLKEADPAVMARLQEPERQAAMKASASAQRYKVALVVAQRNLKTLADAGVLVAMGTDAGPFPERFQGYFEHLEMELMAAAGLTPAQVLRSATGDAGRALKVEGLGTLTKGAWADFVVLERDPLQDIRNTRSVTGVWIAGNPVKR